MKGFRWGRVELFGGRRGRDRARRCGIPVIAAANQIGREPPRLSASLQTSQYFDLQAGGLV